tara:strand:- start:165 stop:341 length:177 start_codon:yes stop_codon:yes gene_type:complete
VAALIPGIDPVDSCCYLICFGMIVKEDLEISHVNDVNNLLDRKKFYFLKKNSRNPLAV